MTDGLLVPPKTCGSQILLLDSLSGKNVTKNARYPKHPQILQWLFQLDDSKIIYQGHMDIAHISATGLCYLCCFLVISSRMGWVSPKIQSLFIKNCFFDVPGGNFRRPPRFRTRKMATSHREFLRDDGASNMYFQGVNSHDVFPTFKIWRSFYLFFCESSSSTERFGGAVKNAPNSRHGSPKNGFSLSSPASWRT